MKTMDVNFTMASLYGYVYGDDLDYIVRRFV